MGGRALYGFVGTIPMKIKSNFRVIYLLESTVFTSISTQFGIFTNRDTL